MKTNGNCNQQQQAALSHARAAALGFELDVKEKDEQLSQLRQELGPYLEVSKNGPLLQAWLDQVDREKRPINDFLVEINQRLERDIEYNVRMEPGVQDCDETLRLARGSCRDSGWLLVQVLRHLGLAARFCSAVPMLRARAGKRGPERRGAEELLKKRSAQPEFKGLCAGYQ